MGKYFGTDGFRGETNVDLTVEHAYKVGRFIAWYYSQNIKKGERCTVVRRIFGRNYDQCKP